MKNSFLCAMALLMSLLAVNFSNAQELHSHSNAASVTNESNSTDGWGGGTTKTADTSDPYDGNYAMKIVSTSSSTTDRRATYTFSVVDGETYNISIWAKEGAQANDPAFALWTGFSGFSTTLISGNTWTEYPFTLTANSTTATIIVFTGSSSGGSVGDEVYIDRVTITPQSQADTQSPTTPTLSSTGQTDTTAELSWSGATDNIAVTGYNVYQDGTIVANNINTSSHQVTGLVASTTYSFTVTALDAAGNMSTVSNTVSVTTDSSSGGGEGSGSSVWSEANSIASYSGEVAVGTASVPTGYKMAIDGKLITEEVKVQLSGNWPDYVFKAGYDLPTLEEIQKHIKEKGHLPNIPSAKEVEVNGVELGEMNKLLLEKIEELTLYIFQLEWKNKEIEKRLSLIEND
ncbi:fibronectin type III domain-containing protein [Flagellimonas sp.]|uniref:fibronectin type III domain-containing protein n=1 Tax=Flagellimonas sp. TaxID=2058762 RepID=UPI003B5BFF26